MNKRLVWNFELDDTSPLDFSTLPRDESAPMRWEARYFWACDTPVVLHGLSERFLNLAAYEIKERQDRYFLLPNHHYNLKDRRQELLYKPLLQKTNDCQGFGKKIVLSTQPPLAILPGISPITSIDLLDLVHSQSIKIDVEKVALIYKLALIPTIKLELARMNIAEQCYFSVCVEGRSQSLVMRISRHLLKQRTPSDYVHFLKSITGLVKP